MTKKDIEIKYNLKSQLLKNQVDKKETFLNIQQNMNNNMPEYIYSPDFRKYPMWPYETDEDFKGTPYEQLPDNNINPPTYEPPYNLPAHNQPAYNQPAYSQPAYEPPYNQPYHNPPFYYGTPIIRNPYVPVGRERISSGYSRTNQGADRELMYLLYRDINKLLYPIIVGILNEYEYDGSPIYQENIDIETISQLIDRVLRRAGEVSNDIQEVLLNDENTPFSETSYMPEWDSINLLKASIEALLLYEIFEIRRPYYRKVRSRYNYENGTYGGINYYQ